MGFNLTPVKIDYLNISIKKVPLMVSVVHTKVVLKMKLLLQQTLKRPKRASWRDDLI